MHNRWWNRSERRSHTVAVVSIGHFLFSGNMLASLFAGVLRRAQYRVSEQNPVPIARNIICSEDSGE